MQSIALKKEQLFKGSEEASTLGLKPNEWPDKVETPFGEMILRCIDPSGARTYAVPFTDIKFIIWND